MLGLKKISKYSNQCYFCLRILGQRNLGLKKCNPKDENDNNNVHKLMAEYKNALLFNSVINSQRISCGYKENNKKMANKVWFKERVATVLKTIRPLPLSFKYVNENNTEGSRVAVNQSINNKQRVDSPPESLMAQNEVLHEDMDHWMTSYDNYEYDLVQNKNRLIIKDLDERKINYGTPNPNSTASKYPCGGCGAYLHCKDTLTPGYIPSEIFENSFKPGGASLEAIKCQRCHFLTEYNIALQVRVSSDDYPRILESLPLNSAFVVLMVDLTDFPCSIWPGIADILGPKTPIIVVGNKVDILPKDGDKFLKRVKEVLCDNIKLCGFASANIKGVELISAKTGFGVEKLISLIQSTSKHRGDVYLIGCVNVGKSSLFNSLLKSDLCKIQAADLIQRASISSWPGTTLNLLKFPITRLYGYRLSLRQERLNKLQALEAHKRNLQKQTLNKDNSVKNATLTGRIERSFDKLVNKGPQDSFSLQGSSNLSGRSQMGIDERHPDYASGKWCFDTPGVVHPGTILHLLTEEEIDMTLPKQLIRPETFCVKPGTTLFIAGLGRLDYVNGPSSIRLTVFRANALPITLCKTDQADFLYKKLVGSELLVIPIAKSDRLTKWPGLELAKSFKVIGKSLKESSYDVVLSSAGWIAINCGFSEYEFQAWTPEKRGVNIRDCVLPKAVTLRGQRIRYSVAYKKK